jgi:hypothetical protein
MLDPGPSSGDALGPVSMLDPGPSEGGTLGPVNMLDPGPTLGPVNMLDPGPSDDQNGDPHGNAVSKFVHDLLAAPDHGGIGAQVSDFAQAQHSAANKSSGHALGLNMLDPGFGTIRYV